MEEISDLIRIITEHTKKNLPLLDLKVQDDQDNKELNLFLGVKSGHYTSDSIASKGIYDEEEVGFKFRMLKSRLNRKLLNHLFFMDFGISKAHKSAGFYQECLDYLHFSKMLLQLGEIKLATKLLYKTADQARECEYNRILHECLFMLRDIYSASYRPKLFRTIQKEIDQNKGLLEKEEQASAIFYESKLVLNSSLTNKKRDFRPLHKSLQKVKDMSRETGSVNIFIQYVKLSIWMFEQEGQFEKSLKFVETLEESLRKGKINEMRFDVNMVKIARLYALLKLRRHSEGLSLVKKHLRETDEETPAWNSFIESHVLFSIYSKDYEGATSLVLDRLNAKAFGGLDENTREKWSLYAVYLYYLTGEKMMLELPGTERLLTSVPEFRKDKAGIHVALLTLQLITRIDDDLEQLREILNAIDDYVTKFLNNSFSKRTKIFYKLLCKITDHDRDFETILKKSKYLVDKLNNAEVEGDVFADLEIVPYEDLWESVLKRLSVLRFQAF